MFLNVRLFLLLLLLSTVISRKFIHQFKTEDVKKLGIVDTEYKEVRCTHHKRIIRVEESSMKPNNLVIKFSGVESEIVAVEVAQAGSSEWRFMNMTNGAVWATMHAPVGALQLRVVVMGKWMWAEGEVLPAEWRAGAVYSSGVEIVTSRTEVITGSTVHHRLTTLQERNKSIKS